MCFPHNRLIALHRGVVCSLPRARVLGDMDEMDGRRLDDFELGPGSRCRCGVRVVGRVRSWNVLIATSLPGVLVRELLREKVRVLASSRLLRASWAEHQLSFWVLGHLVPVLVPVSPVKSWSWSVLSWDK